MGTKRSRKATLGGRSMKFFRDAWPVVVIAATIAGAAWTAAWNVRDFLTAQIAASETRLAAQIVELRRYVVDHLADHAGRGSTPDGGGARPRP